MTCLSSLDFKWYKKYIKCGSFQSYAYLDGDKNYRNKVKNWFLARKIENPLLDYPKINQLDLRKKETFLLSLKEQLYKKEKNNLIKQAYLLRIQDKLIELQLLKNTITFNAKEFKKCSEWLYGKPSKNIINFISQSLINYFNSFINTKDDTCTKLVNGIVEILNLKPSKNNVFLPDNRLLSIAYNKTNSEFKDLLKLVPKNKEIFSSKDIELIFNVALKVINARNWRAIIDEGSRTDMVVNQEEMLIKIPKKKKVK